MSNGGNLPSEFGVVNSSEPIPWRGFRAFDKAVFIALPLAATATAILPFLDPLLFRRIARLVGGRPLVAWLVSGGAWIAAAGLLAVLAVYVLWRRLSLVNNEGLWSGSGCPACGEHELVRVSRHFSDRFYNLAAVPAHRYACRNCTWRGLRISRRERPANHEAQLEAALLRFDPDAHLGDGAPRPETEEATPRHVEALFRDLGDVDMGMADVDRAGDWDEAEADDTPSYANGAEGDALPTNHESDELAADMDWIWRRPSGTDQI